MPVAPPLSCREQGGCEQRKAWQERGAHHFFLALTGGDTPQRQPRQWTSQG